MAHPFRRRTAITAVAVLLGFAVAVSPAAARTWPAAPTQVHVVAVTTTSLTVGAARSANATGYRLWTSPNRADLREPALSHPRAARRTAGARTPLVTVGGLTYRSGVLYYRFASVNGSHRRLSDIRSTYLRPAVPAAVTAPDPFGRPYLRWTDADVSGYQVRMSSDPAGASPVATYTLHGWARSFAAPSTTMSDFYLSVRALNGSTGSAYSTPVLIHPTVGAASLTVMAQNLMNSNLTSYNGAPVPPWLTQRRDAAVALDRQADPDIIGIQEGGTLVGTVNRIRQVDSLRNALGSDYTVAHTEIEPGTRGFQSHGVYIVYRNTRLDAVGDGSTLRLTDSNYAAFQVLRDTTTGGELLAVTAHLVAGGPSADATRRQEMTQILAEAQRIAGAHGNIPMVLAGCLHEAHSSFHPGDSPYDVLSGADFSDALVAAQSRSGADLNTFNNYLRPIRKGAATDRVFAGAGVGVTSWVELLHRSGNQLAGVIPSDHNPVAATVVVPTVPGS
ncbi:MAG TPA: hypothetical protein VJ872_09295 [Nocardioides sp.]|nr:hypothetical protein [Nocardioides sp.]